ncbi:MAG: PEGA domain-containing protein [Candidatus Omnitrophica bacterium]|nr:PEGA domain-containing protein [Candidatus Omnitrophota bacterium]
MFTPLEKNHTLREHSSLTGLNFQRIRGVLFYLSVFLFFAGLPFILSYALGYKFNRHTLKFTKTGLISVKTQPAGAKIYLNGKLIPDRSPASMQELVPGVYKIVLELAQHYPWKGEVDVEAGKVSRLDKVILFPLRPNLQQLNQENFSFFHVDSEKKLIYYLDAENKVVYRSNLDSSNFEDIASLPEKFTQIVGWQVPEDKKKLFVFNRHQIGVVFFDNQGDYGFQDSFVFLDYPQEKIIQVFWHADSYHLIVLTDKHVQVIEARPQAKPVNLVELNKEGAEAFYDNKENELYFSDSQRSPDGSFYNNLYRVDLSPSLISLEKLMIQPFKGVKSIGKEDKGG